jgi:RimJ/RimL family protein N-acetyltransferase
MHLDCGSCIVRYWRDGDRESLVRYADNHRVWRNLKDRFPHPYTTADAETWLALARAVSEHALGQLGFLRPEAPVLAWNLTSMRVLEKCGFARVAPG